MNRRVIIISIAVLVLLLAGAGVYYFVADGPAPEPQPVAEQAPSAEVVAAEAVISPVLSFNGETVWFMGTDGKLYRQAVVAGSSKEEYLLPAAVPNPRKVIWQQKGSDFIVEQALSGHSRYKFYSATTKVFTDLSERVRDPRFLPDEKQIVYLWVAEDGRGELTISAPDGTNFKKLSDLYRPDYKMVVSPAKNQILLFADDAQNPDNLLLVDLGTAKFTSLDEKTAYSDARFSPDGKLAVVEKNGELVVYDLTNLNSSPLSGGGEVGGLRLSQTVWSKDSSELYVAEQNSIRAYSVPNKSWRDVYTFPSNNNLMPAEIFLHPDKPILFFIDQASGYLYRLDLE